jgi:hypothetical protein
MKNRKTPMPKPAKPAKPRTFVTSGIDGPNEIKFCCGSCKRHRCAVVPLTDPIYEAESIDYRIESDLCVYRFKIKQAVNIGNLTPRNVVEITDDHVLFSDGQKFERPNYSGYATEILPADERSARLAARTVWMLEHGGVKNDRQTAKNPKGAGAKPMYDRKKDKTIFDRWNKWRAQPGYGKGTRPAFIEEAGLDMTPKHLERLINREQKRRNG